MHRFAQLLLVLPFVLAAPTAQAAYNITLVGSGGSVTLPPSPYTATSTVTLNGPGMFGAAAGGDMLMFTNTSAHGADAGNIVQTSGPLNASNIGAVYLEAVGSIDLQSSLTGSNTLQLWANYGGSSAGTTYSANANCASCSVLLHNTISANAADLRTGDSSHTGGIINQLGGGITANQLTGFSTGDVTLTGNNQIQSLGSFSAKSNFNLANHVALTQSAALAVAGASNFQAGSNAITLTDAGNALVGAVSLGSGSATLVNNQATVLGASAVIGSLVVSSNGALAQNGVLVVAGTSNFQAGGNAITLTNAGNAFAGAVNLSGGNVSLTNGQTTTLGTDMASGSLVVNSHGALAQVGAQGGSSVSLSSLSGGITLGGDVTTAGNLQLSSANAAITQTAGTLTKEATAP